MQQFDRERNISLNFSFARPPGLDKQNNNSLLPAAAKLQIITIVTLNKRMCTDLHRLRASHSQANTIILECIHSGRTGVIL